MNLRTKTDETSYKMSGDETGGLRKDSDDRKIVWIHLMSKKFGAYEKKSMLV